MTRLWDWRLTLREIVKPIVRRIIILCSRPDVPIARLPFWISVFRPWIKRGIPNALCVPRALNLLVMIVTTNGMGSPSVKLAFKDDSCPSVASVSNPSRITLSHPWDNNGIWTVSYVRNAPLRSETETTLSMMANPIVRPITIPYEDHYVLDVTRPFPAVV